MLYSQNTPASNGYMAAKGNGYSIGTAAFNANIPGAFPGGSMHKPAAYLGYQVDNADRHLYQDTTADGSDDGLDYLRSYMENGQDMHGNPLDARMQAQFNYVVNDPRKTEQEIKTLIANIRPDEDLPKENREGTPKELAYPLYEHQKLALTWLKKMEEGSNQGGILADDMGLGKTISALALIVSRPSDDPARKVSTVSTLARLCSSSLAQTLIFPQTTLIIAPVALVRQWEREIKMKVKPMHRLSVANLQ